MPTSPICVRWSSTEWFRTDTLYSFGRTFRRYNVAYLCVATSFSALLAISQAWTMLWVSRSWSITPTATARYKRHRVQLIAVVGSSSLTEECHVYAGLFSSSTKDMMEWGTPNGINASSSWRRYKMRADFRDLEERQLVEPSRLVHQGKWNTLNTRAGSSSLLLLRFPSR